MAITLGFLNRGIGFIEYRREILDICNKGGAKVQGIYETTPAQADLYLARTWRQAQEYLREHPKQRPVVVPLSPDTIVGGNSRTRVRDHLALEICASRARYNGRGDFTLSSRELGECIGVSNATAAKALRSLIERGFLARLRDGRSERESSTYLLTRNVTAINTLPPDSESVSNSVTVCPDDAFGPAGANEAWPRESEYCG